MTKIKLKQPIMKLRVLCKACGRQELVATPLKLRLPTLYCGWCGDREPLVEHIRR